MSQISPPLRILLAGSILFMAAWFVFLRPGAADTAPPAPAVNPAAGLGNAVQGAQAASAATTAATAARAGEETGAAPGTAPAPQPAAAAAKKPARQGDLALPPSVAKAVAQKKVLVMLFWNENAIDDQAVRRELRGIDRKKGKVKVHVASINDVARYAPITRGVNLEQSPSIVVARGGSADVLVGFVDAETIDQTVSDVMRSTVKKK